MPAIDFIYFDLGKVILNFSHQRACQQMADVANVSFDSVWSALFESELQNRYETGTIDSAQFHAEFSKQTNSDSDCSDLLRAYSHIFSLNLPILPLITHLALIDFPRGILSNTCLCHWTYVLEQYTAVRDLFPIRTLSFEAKSMKPDAGIYKYAIERAGVEPSRIFFTDDRDENVTGAIAAGMDAVLFESASGLSTELRKRGVDV